MSYSDNVIIDTPPQQTGNYNFTELENLQKELEEIKLLMIIFGSTMMLILMFVSVFYVITHCKKETYKKNCELQLTSVTTSDEESDKTTLI
mgnify:CR=1 FL=1|tara:strand:- start:316 stop:588 length:273 start_codon:yes stop_codon:yes gene_type:complete